MLPIFARTALLLDLDGTLLDFAPTPDSVVVPPGLTDTLRALETALGGALAIVTGRSLDVLDGFLGHKFVAAGEHGGAIRLTQGGPIMRLALPVPPPSWLVQAEVLADSYPGALLEEKARGFALHYRQAPEAGTIFEGALSLLVRDDPRFQLLAGAMVWEVRPVGVDKGSAVTTLMAAPPFLGRLPLFIGDDVTDEDGMRVAREMGGEGLRVEPVFGSPEGVRIWLRQAAAKGEWP